MCIECMNWQSFYGRNGTEHSCQQVYLGDGHRGQEHWFGVQLCLRVSFANVWLCSCTAYHHSIRRHIICAPTRMHSQLPHSQQSRHLSPSSGCTHSIRLPSKWPVPTGLKSHEVVAAAAATEPSTKSPSDRSHLNCLYTKLSPSLLLSQYKMAHFSAQTQREWNCSERSTLMKQTLQ